MPAKADRISSQAPRPEGRFARTRLGRALTAPLRAARGYLLGSVRLTRVGKNIHVKLTPTHAPVVAAAPPPDKATLELQAMRDELKQLLNAHPMTRNLMRHLVYVDAALQQQGIAALSEVPVEVLAKAVEQLESLVANWSNVRLADLRSKMSVAVVQRSRDAFYGDGGENASAFHTASRLQVDDVSHSMFMQIEASYKGLVAPDEIQAALRPTSAAGAAGAQA
jgi:hypothetical protein